MPPSPITELLQAAVPEQTEPLDFDRAFARGRARRRRHRAAWLVVPTVALAGTLLLSGGLLDDDTDPLVITDDERSTPITTSSPTTLPPSAGDIDAVTWHPAEERLVAWLFNPRETLVLTTNADVLIPGGECGPTEAAGAMAGDDVLIWLAQRDPAGPMPSGAAQRPDARERATVADDHQCLVPLGSKHAWHLEFADQDDRHFEGFLIAGEAASAASIESAWHRIIEGTIPDRTFENSIYEDTSSEWCGDPEEGGTVVPGLDFSLDDGKGTSDADQRLAQQMRDGWVPAGDDSPDSGIVGWVSLEEEFCSDPFEEPPERTNVYAEPRSDEIVGYMYPGSLGYVDRETADALGFDPEQALIDKYGADVVAEMDAAGQKAIDDATEEMVPTEDG